MSENAVVSSHKRQQEIKNDFMERAALKFKENNPWYDFSSYSIYKRFGDFIKVQKFYSRNNFNYKDIANEDFLVISSERALSSGIGFFSKGKTGKYLCSLNNEYVDAKDIVQVIGENFISPISRAILFSNFISVKVYISNGRVSFFSMAKNFMAKNVVENYSFSDFKKIADKDIFYDLLKESVLGSSQINEPFKKALIEMKVKLEILIENIINSKDSFFSLDLNLYSIDGENFDFTVNTIQPKPGIYKSNWVRKSFYDKYICIENV